MARKKSGPTKSDAVREVIGQNPRMKTAEIVSTLAGRGISVSKNLVYGIKMRGKAKLKKQKRDAALAAGNSAGLADPVTVVRNISELAATIGGLRKLKQLVDIMSEPH